MAAIATFEAQLATAVANKDYEEAGKLNTEIVDKQKEKTSLSFMATDSHQQQLEVRLAECVANKAYSAAAIVCTRAACGALDCHRNPAVPGHIELGGSPCGVGECAK